MYAVDSGVVTVKQNPQRSFSKISTTLPLQPLTLLRSRSCYFRRLATILALSYGPPPTRPAPFYSRVLLHFASTVQF